MYSETTKRLNSARKIPPYILHVFNKTEEAQVVSLFDSNYLFKKSSVCDKVTIESPYAAVLTYEEVLLDLMTSEVGFDGILITCLNGSNVRETLLKDIGMRVISKRNDCKSIVPVNIDLEPYQYQTGLVYVPADFVIGPLDYIELCIPAKAELRLVFKAQYQQNLRNALVNKQQVYTLIDDKLYHHEIDLLNRIFDILDKRDKILLMAIESATGKKMTAPKSEPEPVKEQEDREHNQQEISDEQTQSVTHQTTDEMPDMPTDLVACVTQEPKEDPTVVSE